MLKKLTIVIAMLAAAIGVNAQDMMEPAVMVSDQISTDGTVMIDSAYSDGFGWIVIHAENDGSFGAVIGQRALNAGLNNNIEVEIDTANATPTLYAMLHSDTGQIGTYEFGTVEGEDSPVANDDGVIAPTFTVELVDMDDQFVGEDNTVTANAVSTAQDGWLVIHSDGGEGPGPVLGFAPVSAGLNIDVAVTLEGDITGTLYPMLHVDTGEAGTYEFGTVEGADGPVNVGGVLTFPISTVPAMRATDQIAFGSDAMRSDDMMATPSVLVDSVLSESNGWVVVHADNDGTFGAVLGFAPVSAGYNENVLIELSTDGLTPVVWPMLHVDTGEPMVYEFGEVEGADGPVAIDGEVLTFPISIAPSINYSGSLDGTTLTVDQAVIDSAGWLAIHADNDGAPGPVIGTAPLLQGVNTNITVELSEAAESVFPMLHYDTGEAGVYEFGTVEGADGPVTVQGSVVVGPLTPDAAE